MKGRLWRMEETAGGWVKFNKPKEALPLVYHGWQWDVFFFTAEQHAALIVVPSLHPVPAPKVLQLEQYNCHPSSQWSTETMPQSTLEGLEQNHSAWGTPGWQLQPPTQQAIQQRLSDRYEAVQAMSFPLLERARLWKSSLSAVDWAPQGQHSFSASWSTNGCLT